MIGLFLSLLSCQTKTKEIKLEAKKVFPIDLETRHDFSQKIGLSHIADSIAYVKLEATDSSLISEISEIRFFDGNYFILDRSANAVFIFNQAGKFIRKIKSEGKGPGEYLSVSSFDVDMQKGNIHMFDKISKKMIIYSLSGQMIREFLIDDFVRDFMVLPSGDYVFYTPDYNLGNSRRGLWKTDVNGKFKKQLVTISDDFRYGGIYPDYFCRISDEKVGLLGGEDKDFIYHITDDSLTIPYGFNVNPKIPEGVKMNPTTNPENMTETAYTKNSYHETKTRLIVQIENGKNSVTLSYNKKTKEREADLKRIVNDIDSVAGVPTMNAVNGAIVFKIPITRILDNPELKRKFRIEGVKENPVLQLIYFK